MKAHIVTCAHRRILEKTRIHPVLLPRGSLRERPGGRLTVRDPELVCQRIDHLTNGSLKSLGSLHVMFKAKFSKRLRGR